MVRELDSPKFPFSVRESTFSLIVGIEAFTLFRRELTKANIIRIIIMSSFYLPFPGLLSNEDFRYQSKPRIALSLSLSLYPLFLEAHTPLWPWFRPRLVS